MPIWISRYVQYFSSAFYTTLIFIYCEPQQALGFSLARGWQSACLSLITAHALPSHTIFFLCPRSRYFCTDIKGASITAVVFKLSADAPQGMKIRDFENNRRKMYLIQFSRCVRYDKLRAFGSPAYRTNIEKHKPLSLPLTQFGYSKYTSANGHCLT
jgi:hypothetical protein